MKKDLLILIVLSIFISITINAQEIGMSWEFNEDGNFEGIIVGNSLQDSSVSNGLLNATVTGSFPAVSSEEFEIDAASYGYFQVRAKIPGATYIKIMWDNAEGVWGFSNLTIKPDTSFHVFNFPVYLSDKWKGKIIKIRRLDFNPINGSKISIDYIRIIRQGQKPVISKFLPLRSVVKPNKEIPIIAVVKNDGDIEANLNSELVLPSNVTLIDGALSNQHGIMFKEDVDTLKWMIKFNTIAKDSLKLKLFSKTDTTEKILSINVTDQYWDPDEFLLSAWSPPYAWYGKPYEDSVFSYYKNANFDNVLWARDDDALIQKVHRFGLKYFLLITPIIGELYLRAPDKEIPPDVTEEMLQLLDDAIDKYKDDPNLLGYHICDEPHKQAFPNIGKVIERIRKKDPTKLSFVNIWPSGKGYREYIDELLQTTKLELLSYDRYHFFNGYDGGEYFSNISVIREYALKYNIPFCNIIQAIGTNGTVEEHLNWRTPSESEHRWLVYSSLTYGVHALIWFHWHGDWGVTGNPDKEKIYPSIQSINAEIDSLKEIMLHLTTTHVYHTKSSNNKWQLSKDGIIKSVSDNADLVAGYFKDVNDREEHFMLMNKDYSDSLFTKVTLNYILDSLEVFDVKNNEWQQVSFTNSNSGASFNVHFRPGAGKLFRFKGETIVGISEVKTFPTQFKLEQNYPNPFNPSTTIKYSLKTPLNPPFLKGGNKMGVTLKVYDILGREVTTLVNKKQNPGNYEVQFDANGLASGLYFYRLLGNGFMQTKKMILLR